MFIHNIKEPPTSPYARDASRPIALTPETKSGTVLDTSISTKENNVKKKYSLKDDEIDEFDFSYTDDSYEELKKEYPMLFESETNGLITRWAYVALLKKASAYCGAYGNATRPCSWDKWWTIEGYLMQF